MLVLLLACGDLIALVSPGEAALDELCDTMQTAALGQPVDWAGEYARTKADRSNDPLIEVVNAFRATAIADREMALRHLANLPVAPEDPRVVTLRDDLGAFLHSRGGIRNPSRAWGRELGRGTEGRFAASFVACTQ